MTEEEQQQTLLDQLQALDEIVKVRNQLTWEQRLFLSEAMRDGADS
jgi:cell division protein FtsX